MKNQKTVPEMMNPGIYMVVTFFVLTIMNMIVIYFANMWFPQQVVLGTMSLSTLWALLLSSSEIALAMTFLWPFVMEAEKRRKKAWAPHEMMALYLVANFVYVWILGRFSEVFGLGLSSWVVVLALAAVLDFFQGIAMMAVEKIRLHVRG